MSRFWIIFSVLMLQVSITAKSQVRDNLFFGIVSSFYIDFISSPVQFVDNSRLIGDSLRTPDSMVPYQTRYLSFFSFGVETRYNLFELGDNFSLAVSAPITFGLGQAVPHNSDVLGAQGFANIQIPLMFKAYIGSTSTYKSTENIGLSVGAGFEYNKVGLFAFGADNSRNKGWIMPAVSGAFHFWRGNSPIEVNIKYGFGQLQTYRQDLHGNVLQDGSRTTKASSLKVSLVYLLDY